MKGLDDIAAGIRKTGARFDPAILQQTRALYRPLVATQPWSTRERIADLAYGEHARQRLDVYPADTVGAPLLLFVHGGGFVAGDKAGDGDFYANVGRYFASRGFCAVTMNYRLAPDHGWPVGAEDVAGAIRWIVQNGAVHGANPADILLLGQSAGASHVASFVFDKRIATQDRTRIRAVGLMSGFYLAAPPLTGGPRAYYGDDETVWHDRSPATHVAAPHPPLLLSVAEFDPAPIAGQSLDLARALNQVDGQTPRLHWLAGHNHVSPVHGLGLGDDEVGEMLTAFFTENVAQTPIHLRSH